MIWFLLFASPILIVLIGLLIRPSYIHLGMTTEEWKSTWPGDDFIPGALPSGSRAIVIEAPAAEVWPWLTQIGQDRAGFYSYRWLENLAGAEMPAIVERRSEWSTRSVGQKLIMAPPKRFGNIAIMDIIEVVEGSCFVAANAEGTWAFIVLPIDEHSCQFVARGTWLPSKNVIARLSHAAIFDPIHFLMEWKMAREIKRLAENATGRIDAGAFNSCQIG